jgi:hypothetical protein
MTSHTAVSPTVLAIFAACASHPGASMSDDRLNTPAVVIRDHADAAHAIGRTVELRGVAVDMKPSGRVENDVFALYCLNISRWPAGVAGEVITVRGILEYTDELSARDPMDQGLGRGPVYLIRHCEIVR